MTISRWLKAASVLLVAGMTIAGVDLLAQRGTSAAQAQPEQKPRPELITYPVRPGKLTVMVVERGSLQSSNDQDVYSHIEGRTTIIRIAPEGTRVKKGEIICELDSAPLRDQLVNQWITTKAPMPPTRTPNSPARWPSSPSPSMARASSSRGCSPYEVKSLRPSRPSRRLRAGWNGPASLASDWIRPCPEEAVRPRRS